MSNFQLIHDHLHHWDQTLARVPVPADRHTLEKRRWRGLAANGVEFGFDLEHALDDGDVIFADAQSFYQIEQLPEPVLEIPSGAVTEAARVGWMIGNLHFKIALTAGSIQAPDDPAIRQLLEREGIAFQPAEAVFRPLRGGHSHGQH